MWVEFDCRKDNNTVSKTCSLSTEQNGELLSSEKFKLNLGIYMKLLEEKATCIWVNRYFKGLNLWLVVLYFCDSRDSTQAMSQ